MTNQQPTQEQIKEFWEWCGCRVAQFTHFLHHDIPCFDLVFPDGKEQRFTDGFLDSIDLNTLFKYAIPRLATKYRNWKSVLHDWVEISTGDTKDALALFWAIWEVIHGK